MSRLACRFGRHDDPQHVEDHRICLRHRDMAGIYGVSRRAIGRILANQSYKGARV